MTLFHIYLFVLSPTRKLHEDRDFVFFIAPSQHSRQWCLVHVFCVLVSMVMIVTFSFWKYSFLGSAMGMSPLCISNWAKQIGLIVKESWCVWSVSLRIAVFSVSVFYDERIVVVAEQRPDASEEDSFQWMSRVLQVSTQGLCRDGWLCCQRRQQPLLKHFLQWTSYAAAFFSCQ